MAAELSNFISDVSAGFQGTSAAFNQTGQQQHLTPGPLPIVQTPMGTAAAVTLPTGNSMVGVSPAVMHQQQFAAYTPPPMSPMVNGGMFAAPQGLPQYQPHMANFMAGGDSVGLPSASYMTAPSMGVYRATPTPGHHGGGIAPTSRTGAFGDVVNTFGGPNFGIGSGMRTRPLGYDPINTQAAHATSLANRAMAVTNTASSFASTFGGALAGDFVGAAAGSTVGTGLGQLAGGAIGGVFGGLPGALLGRGIGGTIGKYGGMLAGGLIGENIGLMAGYAMNPTQALVQRRKDYLRMQSGTRGVITTGGQLDVTGTGLSSRASSGMAQGVYGMAAESSLFNREDYMKISKLAMDGGMVNMANTPDQVLKTVKDVSKSLKIFMSVAGDPDVQSAMSRMSDMYRMGISVPRMVEAQSNIRQFARMAGVSVDEAMDTYGAQGGYSYKQAGLSQGAGVQMGVAGAGVANAIVQSGSLSQADVNRLGGVSGMAQSISQSAAGFLGGASSMVLPGLMMIGPDGKPVIDQKKIQAYQSGKLGFNDLIRDQSIFKGKDGVANLQYYMNNTERLQTELADSMGPSGTLAFMLRAMEDQKKQMPGATVQTVANFVTGGDRDTALVLAEMYQNPTALRSMVTESDRERRRTGSVEHTRWLEENTAWQRNIARPLREGFTSAGQAVWGGPSGRLAEWEDSRRAESTGMHLRRNKGTGFRLTEQGGGGSDYRAGVFNDKASWYSLSRPADDILYRAMGYEGIATSVSNLFRGRSGSQFGDSDNVNMAAQALMDSAAMYQEDLSQDQLGALSQRLTATLGQRGSDRALAFFRSTASAHGRDNAALTRQQFQRKFGKRYGTGLSDETASMVMQYGAALYGGNRDVALAVENTTKSADQLRALGSSGMGQNDLRKVVSDEVRENTGIKIGTGWSGAGNSLIELMEFSAREGLAGEDNEGEVLDLLADATVKTVGADGGYGYAAGYNRAQESRRKLFDMGHGALLSKVDGDSTLQKSMRKLHDRTEYARRTAKGGPLGIGSLAAAASDAGGSIAWRNLETALSDRGLDVSGLSGDYSIAGLRSIDDLSSTLKGKSDEDVMKWAEGVLSGHGSTTHVGGAMGVNTMQDATNQALLGFSTDATVAASKYASSAESMKSTVKTFGEHVEMMGLVLQENRNGD